MRRLRASLDRGATPPVRARPGAVRRRVRVGGDGGLALRDEGLDAFPTDVGQEIGLRPVSNGFFLGNSVDRVGSTVTVTWQPQGRDAAARLVSLGSPT